MPDLELVFNEEEGVWEERPEPYIIVEIETEEDYALLQKAIDHYHKHGRWENVTGGMIKLGNCSICKVRQCVIGTNYCINCGARMGGDGDV